MSLILWSGTRNSSCIHNLESSCSEQSIARGLETGLNVKIQLHHPRGVYHDAVL